MREQDGQDEGKKERESKKRAILIEGAIMELARNLVLKKLPRIPAKNLKQ